MRLKFIAVLALLLISTHGHAKLNGKNVVLVHGLQTTHLGGTAPNDAGLQRDANSYWRDYWGSRAEAILYWSASERIAGGIKDDMRAQIKRLEALRTCRAGCVFVTHSTGDLVLRDALSRLGQWGVNPANLVLGFVPRRSNLGVLIDLRPTVARTIAVGANITPRLRFVGTGSQYLSVTKPFLPGEDDSVVSLHSSCGSRFIGSYQSCNRGIRANGALRSSRAPSSFYFNHFAVLMGSGTNHSETNNNSRSGYMATVVNRVTRGLNLDFNDYTTRKWWAGFRKVRIVRNSDNKSMSANIYDTLNR